MTRLFSAYVQKIRDEARRVAVDVLRGRGFRESDNAWIGDIELSGGSTVRVEVVLPERFPDCLPRIFLRSPPLSYIAHVGHDGHICIPPEDGVLLDSERPAAIIEQSLDLVANVLNVQADSSQEQEIADEFVGYWRDVADEGFLSICPPASPTGAISMAILDGTPRITLIAPSEGHASEWCSATGHTVRSMEQAFFIRLRSLPAPPARGRPFTLRAFIAAVADHTAPGHAGSLWTWLTEQGLPALVLLSAPTGREPSDAVFACLVPEARAGAAEQARRGFRPGRVPKALTASRAKARAVERLKVHRADPEYLLYRGGAETCLRDKSVVLVGCGAVGSFVAQALALAGAGTLRLVDHDALATDNVHRHALGLSEVKSNKATAMSKCLRARFPHMLVDFYPEQVESLLDRDAQIVLSADLVIVAIGNETLERRLNLFLFGKVSRLHTWVEPLGLGGHALSLARDGPGCFECLYRRNEQGILLNMAALAEPGQQFQRGVAGCAGTFTPYGGLDAEQAGIHAAREAIRMLKTDQATSELLSWSESADAFLEAGFQLTVRGTRLVPGTSARTADFAQPDCPVCGKPIA